LCIAKKILASFKETFIPTSMITIELNWDLQHIFFVVFSEYKKNEFMYIHDTSKITFFLHFFRHIRKTVKSYYELHHVCLSAWNKSAATGQIFMKFDIWKFFENLSGKFKFHLKLDKNRGYSTWTPIYIFYCYLTHFFLEWEMFQTKVAEKIKTHVLCSVMFCRQLCLLWDNVEKYWSGGQATDDNMVHANCMLGT